MSGFEVVAVVLGAIPLILASLKAYEEVSRRRDLFSRRGFHVKRLINAVSEQRILIEADIETVLRSAGIEDATLQQAKNGAFRDLLNQAEVVEDVRHFMGRSYDTYFSIIEDCELTLLKIAKAVGRYREGAWSPVQTLEDLLGTIQPTKKSGNDFLKRLKFSMGKAELESTIGELDRSTQRLSRLRISSTTIHQVAVESMNQRTMKTLRALQMVRKRALSLYHAISSHHTRACHEICEARLAIDCATDLLEIPYGHGSSKPTSSDCFIVVLKGSTTAGAHFDHVEAVELMQHDHESSPSNANSQVSRVSFALPSLSPGIKQEDLRDICTMVEARPPQQAIKVYLHPAQKFCYATEPHVAGHRLVSDFRLKQAKTVKEILQSHNDKPSLMRRVQMSAVIALLTLQLYATPWCEDFRKETLLFLMNSSGLPNKDLSNIYVGHSFKKKPAWNANKACSKAPDELLELGIPIIEMWFGKTIEDFCQQTILVLEDTYDSRQVAARRWLHEAEGEFVAPVYEAAFRCVECRFDMTKVTWDDEAVRRSVFDGVVKPLWQNCQL